MNERKQKILIVDDSEMNRSILADMLGEEFDIIEACDGAEAIKYIRSYGVDISLVLLDIVMPKMDGLEVLAMMNSYKWIQDIPVIMISAESASSYIGRAYELGATDYIQRPFDATVVYRRVMNAIMLYAKQKKLIGLVEDQIYKKEKEQSLLINILSHIVEFRNGESGLHVLHIYTMTEIILQTLLKRTDKYKLTPEQISLIATASALHDIGKIAIDDKILNKPGKFTPEEFEIMKKHAEYGADMLDKIPFYKNEPLLKVAKEICRWHHERYDGKGYPDGLKGDQIPISAQVVALADVYDALTSERVYKKAYSHDEAIRMILGGECGVFNPELMNVLEFAAAKIQNELRVNSLSGNSSKDINRITREIISHSELTASTRTLDLLEREREKYKFIASVAKEVVFEIYRDPLMISFLDEGSSLLGVDTSISNPLHDRKLADCFGKANLEKLFSLLESATQEEPIVSFECDVKFNGHQRRCRVTVMTQYYFNASTGKYSYESAVGKLEDITEFYNRIEALEIAATTDNLTGLLNHNYVKLEFERCCSEQPDRKFALAVIDMDDFKKVNDIYGHLCGDEILKTLATRIREALPKNGFAGRVGGDEFVAIWADDGNVQKEAERIYKHISKKFDIDEASASMGIATTEISRSYDALFRCSDKAMYAAKEKGKKRYCFYTPEMGDF